MRQENGATLLGIDDPRSDTIGVIHVAPDDTRESILQAIHTQDKLKRKQIAIVLPSEPNKAFQRPVDFDGLKNMRRKLNAQLNIVAPAGPGPATFARQRHFPVFSSLDKFKDSLGNIAPAPSAPPQQRGRFGRKANLEAMERNGRHEEPPTVLLSPENVQNGRPISENRGNGVGPEQNKGTGPSIAAMGTAAGLGLIAGEAMSHQVDDALAPPTHGNMPPSSPMPRESTPPPVNNGNAPPPSGQAPAHQDVMEPPDPSNTPNARNSGSNSVRSPNGSEGNTATFSGTPPSNEEPRPIALDARRGRNNNSGKMGAVGRGVAGVAAGAAMASGAAGNVGNPPVRRGTGGGAGAGSTGGAGIPPDPRRRRRRRWLIALLLLLLLSLLFCTVVAYAAPNLLRPLRSVVPSGLTGAPSATVTITPKHADLKNAYVITAVTGTPDASSGRQVQARFLKSNIPSQSKTVSATGQRQTPGVAAHGTLTFLNGSTSPFSLKSGESFISSSGNGLTVVTDAFVTISAANPPTFGHGSVSAHVTTVGAAGNSTTVSGNCCDPHGFITVASSAFTGGQDPQNYTIVQQGDIDGAANPLKGPLTQSATNSVNGQKRAGEQLVNAPSCTTDVASNHNVGDKATSVTVTVTAKCTAEAYDLKGAQTLAASALTKQAAKNPGAGYALVDGIATNSSITGVDSKGIISLSVKAEGVWVYQFSNDLKTQLAKLIAGKSKSAAQALLMQQAGVDTVNSIDSATLPTDYTKITIVIENVPGVQGNGTPPVGSGTGTPTLSTPTEPKGIVTPTAGIGGS